ncbi:MAG TPA: ribonuclease HII [Actinomycetota bacterium]|nr:ribonuclease HII [Actinomycetota bacterium]
MAGGALGLMERRLADAGFELVAGVDEVGRGALAGPLFAGAVVLPKDVTIEGLRDSKLCTRLQRERLAHEIKKTALAWSIVRVRPDKIDRVGIQPCNREALRRAVRNLTIEPEYVLVDFMRMKRLPWRGLLVKKADACSKNVAAASIIAKVARDATMRRYHRKYPQYGFATNVGYKSRQHWEALMRFGPTPIHRRSFYGVVGFLDEDGVLRPHQARDLDPAVGDLQGEPPAPGDEEIE